MWLNILSIILEVVLLGLDLVLAGKVKETGEWLKGGTEDATQYTVKGEKTTDWKQIFLEVSYRRLFLFLWIIAVSHFLLGLSE